MIVVFNWQIGRARLRFFSERYIINKQWHWWPPRYGFVDDRHRVLYFGMFCCRLDEKSSAAPVRCCNLNKVTLFSCDNNREYLIRRERWKRSTKVSYTGQKLTLTNDNGA